LGLQLATIFIEKKGDTNFGKKTLRLAFVLERVLAFEIFLKYAKIY